MAKISPVAQLLLPVTILFSVTGCESGQTANKLPVDSIRNIAKDAYIYGFPMIEHYRIIYASAQDSTYRKFAPVNSFYHEKNVAGPEDTLFVAPNGDTPYSYAVLDLRDGPLILTIPPHEEGRYIGFPLYDLYTQIIFTFSKRTVGNTGGSYLIAPVSWEGPEPEGIDTVIRSETDIVYILTRTQLINAKDLPLVHSLQSKYELKKLGAPEKPSGPTFTHTPLPPETPQTQPDLAFFDLMNYLLQFCHPHPSEKGLLERFSSIGIISGKPFRVKDSVARAAVLEGMQQGKEMMMKKLPTVKYAAELFGTREQLKNDYLGRAVGAWAGIYANQVEEFMGLQGFEVQSDGTPYNGQYKYKVTFKKGDLPPVDGFWSITMYKLPSRFMYANPLNRNLINSNMVPSLKRNADSSITIYIQHDSPGKKLESNWLPAPAENFMMSFRTYLPRAGIRNGTWKTPQVEKIIQ